MSMALTSRLHRRRTPQKNRGIPTISTGCFDSGIVDVSAVDTGLLVAVDSQGMGCGAGSSPSLGPAYSTRVGIYWPGDVRTARRPYLPGVPPTLLQ